MKPVIHNNFNLQQIIRINTESITYRKGDIIRAKIQNINSNGISIKLANGQSLLARVDGQWIFELGSWVCFEISERTPQMVKLKPIDNIVSTGINQISQYMDMLGLARTPENEAMLYFMLIQGIPLNKDNVLFFINKRFKLSKAIRLLIQVAKSRGMGEYAQTLDSAFLELETSAIFLKNIYSSIKKAHHEIINLCNKIMEKETNGEIRSFIKDIFNGILFQMNENLPFQMIQLPIKIDDQLLDSEIWYDGKSDILYMEFDLPHLGAVGCLLTGGRSKTSLTFYCAPDYYYNIKKEIDSLKKILKDLGIKVEKIEVCNILEQHGLKNFLKRYWNNEEIIDIKV